MTQITKINLFFVKPSKYDDDGYVIRYWKGVLPSNTLACLYGISEDVRKREVLGKDLRWKIEVIDETVQRVPCQKIIRASRSKHAKTIVCLAGVQSNQFPRASDLALQFAKEGISVLIGGFHVSGMVSTLGKTSPDIELLIKAGVTIVAGEVEGVWEEILRDALKNQLKPVYNFLHSLPDLAQAPVPRIPRNLMNRYAARHMATLDCGRGCPFACTFCTVINVQGRLMRFRSVEKIVQLLRENYHEHEISYYFFTDDNFSRNKSWNAIFDAMIRLRKEEKIALRFMMQVDTQSHRIPHFVEKASEAGCTQVFIGMESLNEENLMAAGKRQNKVADFNQLISIYHEAGIVTHLAYILGFPFDNFASVKEDLVKLRELGAEQASFFMLTPLPGSVDYRSFLSQSKIMDADLNNFDSFHATFRHAQMKSSEWNRAYQEAWKYFYGVDNMKKILRSATPKKYWGIFMNFVWYKNAIEVEEGHPMLHGFLRLKGRSERRPIYHKESLRAYAHRRIRDVFRMLSGWVRLVLEMEEVWLATRQRSLVEERVLVELFNLKKKVLEWRSLKLGELQMLYQKAAFAVKISSKDSFGFHPQVPSRLALWIQKWNFFSDSLTFTRSPMEKFWKKVRIRFKHGRIHQINFYRVIVTSIREAALFSRFILSLLERYSPSTQKGY